jgi:hypothetical protein
VAGKEESRPVFTLSVMFETSFAKASTSGLSAGQEKTLI